MKNIDEMTLDQKVLELMQAITREKMNQDSTLDEETLDNMLNLARNASTLVDGRLFDFTPEDQQRALTEYNDGLDEALMCFNGYEKTSISQKQRLG